MPRTDLKRVLLDSEPEDLNMGGFVAVAIRQWGFFCEGCAFTLFEAGTIMMVVLSCVATLCCAKGILNLEWDASMSIVAIGSIFPLVFSIQASYHNREMAVRSIGGLKANIFTVFCTFQAWCDQCGLPVIDDIEGDLTHLLGDILVYLRSRQPGVGVENSEPEKAHTVYDYWRRVFKHVETFKTHEKPPSPPEIATMNNFIRFAMVDFEEARTVADYRTPRGLRLFCYVVIHVSPIFLAPYFNRYCTQQNDSSHDTHLYGCQSGYFMAILFVLINSTLLKVQQQLENPFDGDGDDDIKWGIWTDQLSQMQMYGEGGPERRGDNVVATDVGGPAFGGAMGSVGGDAYQQI
mmetsp:Transcript_29538/g.74266  ORF Transcript_29538/g.74266 Transcript_29538/m.74266 type:complete len:349 (+) Transcript_29538:197-1243(+)